MDAIALIIALILVVPGVFMAFVPMLPALSYMFVVSLAFALFDHFTRLTGTELLMLLGVTLLSIIVDHTAGLVGAKYGGAHTKSLFWGFGGAILGTFVFPVFGSFAGLFVGVLVAELYYKKPEKKAFKAAGSALLGSVTGVIVNVMLSIVFASLFAFFIIR